MMEKRRYRVLGDLVASLLFFVLFSCILAGCTGQKRIMWEQDPDYGVVAPSHIEYGELFAVPSAIVGNDKGEYFGDAVLQGVEDPNGNAVTLSGTTFIAETKGDYKFSFSAVNQDMKAVLVLHCKDSTPPRVSITPENRYALKTYGEQEPSVYEYPYVSAHDVSEINEEKTVRSLYLNGEEVPLQGNTFTLQEEGLLLFRTYVEDREGNGSTAEAYSVAYEQMLPPRTPAEYVFEDETLSGFTLAAFDKADYVNNVGYDGKYLFHDGDFTSEILDSDSDGTTEYDGVLKMYYPGTQVRSAARIYFKPVPRSEVGALHITIRTENAERSPVNDDWFNIIFFNPVGGNPYWLSPNLHDYIDATYRTVTIDDPSVLDSLADTNGNIGSIVVETFNGNNKTVYIADISYSAAEEIFIDDSLSDGVLAAFDRDEYVNNVSYSDTWLRRPFQSREIVEDDAAPHGKALKVSWLTGDSLDEACIAVYLAKPVLRSQVKSLSVTLRVENFTVRDGLFNLLIFKDMVTPWGVPSEVIIAEDEYKTYTITNPSVLNAMTDGDGYIRSLHIETFGGTEARHLYLAEISYEEETNPQPEREPYIDPSLTGNCLGTYNSEQYVNNVGSASDVFTDYWPQTAEMSVEGEELKIVYSGSRGESWARVYFGAAVKREDVTAINIKMRIENCSALNNDTIYLVFFGNTSEWAKDGYYTHPNVGSTSGVFSITDAGVLDYMTDSDGYIRSVAIVTFGGTNQTIYIDEITYDA